MTTRPASRTRSARSSCDAGVTVLDGEATEIEGVGFAGVKGFAGGFGRGALGPVGRAGDQAVRAGGGGRGDEARNRARSPADASSALRSCTTRRFAEPSRVSRRRSFRISARAASRSRSTAIASRRSSMGTRIAARRRDAPRRASRSTTWRCRCSHASILIDRRIWSWSSPCTETPRSAAPSPPQGAEPPVVKTA